MPRKLILCRCEDVTAADVDHAVATGFADLEEVKRYTGFGTGPCQGKECLRAVALHLAATTGRSPTSILPFTTRPPLVPTALKLLADRSEQQDSPASTLAAAPAPSPSPLSGHGGKTPGHRHRG